MTCKNVVLIHGFLIVCYSLLANIDIKFDELAVYSAKDDILGELKKSLGV